MRHATSLLRQVETLGRLRFALLAVLLCAGAAWLAGGVMASWPWSQSHLVNDEGANIGRDFIAPYAAATLARAGDPAAASDFERLHAVEQEILGAPEELTPWLYPPTALLLMLPLALLPYLAALALWLAAQVAVFIWALRRLFPHPLMPALVLAFPGTGQSLLAGQNGLFTATLIAGGLGQLERRPLLAGLCFGGLAYKPQMALAVFCALLFGAHWRSLAMAIVTALGFAAASALVLGIAPWLAFLHQLDGAMGLFRDGLIPLDSMVTAFGALRLAGAGMAAASAVQLAVTLTALAALAHVWRRRGDLAWRGAALALAIPLTTPYAFNYDLPLLLLPIAWLAGAGLATGFRRGEALLLVAAWISPVAGWLLAGWSHLLLTPLILALLLIGVVRRARSPSLVTAGAAARPGDGLAPAILPSAR